MNLEKIHIYCQLILDKQIPTSNSRCCIDPLINHIFPHSAISNNGIRNKKDMLNSAITTEKGSEVHSRYQSID